MAGSENYMAQSGDETKTVLVLKNVKNFKNEWKVRLYYSCLCSKVVTLIYRLKCLVVS